MIDKLEFMMELFSGFIDILMELLEVAIIIMEAISEVIYIVSYFFGNMIGLAFTCMNVSIALVSTLCWIAFIPFSLFIALGNGRVK